MEPSREYNNGNLESEHWHMDGRGYGYHRVDGPAYTRWSSNGQIIAQEYCIDNRHHRVNGPAHIEWYDNGQLLLEIYWVHGKRHCTTGPAYNTYNIDGSIDAQRYYVQGAEITEDEFIQNYLEYKIAD